MRTSVTMFIVLVMLIAVSSATNYSSRATDYCHIPNCEHTMCKYPNIKPAARCQTVLASGLTADEKIQVLTIHNEFRQKVASGQETRGSPGPQPAAVSMPDLTWDDELATIAQRWADQCSFGHDSCRSTSTYDPVGQNVAVIGTTGDVNSLTVENLMEILTDEVQYFDSEQVTSFDVNGGVGGEIGHYTQLVWATTTAVGCGASKYEDNGFNNFYLVCNYGPAGNYPGEQIYQPA